jgi:hypothetical protein
VRRREHHASHRVVVARRLEGGDQVGEQLVRERVARVRLVQADRRDVLVDAVQQRFEVGQGASLLVWNIKWASPTPQSSGFAERSALSNRGK